MMAALSRLIDWAAIRTAAARMPQPDGRDAHVAEAQQLIDSSEFIPASVKPARLHFSGANQFYFESPHPGPFAENNVAHGCLYRCGENWQGRPTVILLHGWNDIINHRVRFPFMARQINRLGINAATLVAPFHFQRRPRQLGASSNFLSPDILRTVEAIGQAIAETRAFAEWLRREGCPSVGLMGVSLGGWLAGLTVGRDATFSSAVLLVPVARLDRLVAEAAFCRGLRPAFAGQPEGASKLNLTRLRPAIPKENVLLIEALYDLFVPPETMEELWNAWDQPEIWRMRCGHISVLAAPGLYGRIIRWMAPRLRAPTSK
jgi:dienelactone hydrolase